MDGTRLAGWYLEEVRMGSGKTGIWVAASLVFGFVAGAMVTRASYHDLEQELARVREERDQARQKEGQRLAAPMASGLRAWLENPSRKAPGQGQRGAGQKPAREPVPSESSAVAETASPLPVTGDRRDENRDADSVEERLALATDTWRLRSAQARAGFLEAVHPDEDQVAALDALVERMNEEVQAVVEEALESWDPESGIERRDVVDLGVALGSVYQEVDDEWRQVLTEEQYERARDVDFDVFTQLDPEVMLPLMERLTGIQ